jgi:ABC-type multidrug transport system fused ATPase/permease subunit
MIPTFMSGIGIGMVWGWYLGLFEGRTFKPAGTIIILTVSSVFVYCTLFLIAGAMAAITGIGVSLATLLIHIILRNGQRLNRQQQETKTEE